MGVCCVSFRWHPFIFWGIYKNISHLFWKNLSFFKISLWHAVFLFSFSYSTLKCFTYSTGMDPSSSMFSYSLHSVIFIVVSSVLLMFSSDCSNIPFDISRDFYFKNMNIALFKFIIFKFSRYNFLDFLYVSVVFWTFWRCVFIYVCMFMCAGMYMCADTCRSKR